MSPERKLPVLTAALALVLLAGCQQILGITDTTECQGPQCNDASVEPTECTESIECPAAATPICDDRDRECRACDDSDECVARDPGLPACVAGSCLECTVNDDCDSGACNTATNACVAASEVVYVDSALGQNVGSCGTQAEPCLTITEALTHVDDTRRFVLAAPGTYSAEGATIAITNQTVTLLADGATIDFDVGAPIITVNGAGNLTMIGGAIVGDPGLITAVFCPMNAATVRLVGVNVSGAGGSGVHCQGSATVEDSVIENNGDVGVNGLNAVNLRVLRSEIKSNGSHGIVGAQTTVVEQNKISANVGIGYQVNGGTTTLLRNEFRLNQDGGAFIGNGDATIVNNFVIRNGRDEGAAIGGIEIVDSGVGITVLVEFNTIAENTRNEPAPGGLLCQVPDVSGVTSKNNLIAFNFNSGNSNSQCNHSYSTVFPAAGIPFGTNMIDLSPQVVAMEAGDWHLTAGSPCKDHSSNDAAVDIDFDGDARPDGAKHDCGADEFVVP